MIIIKGQIILSCNSFVHSFFQILSNIFLRTTAFNTHLKNDLFKKKNFFFSPRLLQFHFKNKWSKHSFQHRLGTTSSTRDPCVERIRESRLFVGHVCWVQDGTYLKPVLTDSIYYNRAEVEGGGGGVLGCQPRLPRATYTCNYVKVVERLQQKQRKYVYCRHVDCVGCRVATSNSCLCE